MLRAAGRRLGRGGRARRLLKAAGATAVVAAVAASCAMLSASGQQGAVPPPRAGNVVTGHVTASETDHSASGMEVAIVAGDETTIVAGPRFTDASGNFLFAHVPVGDYALRAQWSGKPYFQRWFSVTKGAPIVVEVAKRGACGALAPGETGTSDQEIADAVRLVLSVELSSPDDDRDRDRTGKRDRQRAPVRGRDRKAPPIPTVPARDLPKAWLARLGGVPVTLMPEEALQRLAEREKRKEGMYYWTLSAKPGSDGCVTVELGGSLRFHENSGMLGMCCTGWTYTLRRVRDRWEFDVVLAWVS